MVDFDAVSHFMRRCLSKLGVFLESLVFQRKPWHRCHHLRINLTGFEQFEKARFNEDAMNRSHHTGEQRGKKQNFHGYPTQAAASMCLMEQGPLMVPNKKQPEVLMNAFHARQVVGKHRRSWQHCCASCAPTRQIDDRCVARLASAPYGQGRRAVWWSARRRHLP